MAQYLEHFWGACWGRIPGRGGGGGRNGEINNTCDIMLSVHSVAAESRDSVRQGIYAMVMCVGTYNACLYFS